MPAKGQEIIRYPELKKQIDSLAEMDRVASRKTMADKAGKKDSLNQIFRRITTSNTQTIKAIFEKYGFLNFDMVGKAGSASFWLIVQHADDDPVFQEAVLKKMKIEVKRMQANGSNFAYLTDRVNVHAGRPQVYGTQLDYKPDGTPFPKPIFDPKNVDKRRKEVGMEPLQKYLDFIIETSKGHH